MDNYIIEKRVRMRLAWFKRYKEIDNISQVCREFSISCKTFYKWWPCYIKQGLLGLKDRSKRPKGHPKSVPKEIRSAHIVKLRQKSHYGPCRLRFYLERDYGIKLGIYGMRPLKKDTFKLNL